MASGAERSPVPSDEPEERLSEPGAAERLSEPGAVSPSEGSESPAWLQYVLCDSAEAHRDMENKVSHSSDELTRILATITIEKEESAGEGDALQSDGRSACSCDLLAGQGQFQDDAGHLGD